MGHDVFISYSTRDQKIADSIVNGLRAAGISCWISSADIRPGSRDYAASIDTAIDCCRIFLILYSSNSRESPDVANEVELAKDSGCTVIPVLIEDTKISGALRYRLITYEWFNKRRVLDEPDIVHLSELIKAMLGADEAPPENTAEEPSTEKPETVVDAGTVLAEVADTLPKPAARHEGSCRFTLVDSEGARGGPFEFSELAELATKDELRDVTALESDSGQVHPVDFSTASATELSERLASMQAALDELKRIDRVVQTVWSDLEGHGIELPDWKDWAWTLGTEPNDLDLSTAESDLKTLAADRRAEASEILDSLHSKICSQIDRVDDQISKLEFGPNYFWDYIKMVFYGAIGIALLIGARWLIEQISELSFVPQSIGDTIRNLAGLAFWVLCLIGGAGIILVFPFVMVGEKKNRLGLLGRKAKLQAATEPVRLVRKLLQ